MIFEDPWIKGKEKIATKDVLHLRDERVCRLTIKTKVHCFILNGMKILATRVITAIIGRELNVRPSW